MSWPLKVWRRAPWLQVVMVNSTWTREHIASLWWTLLRPYIVYPPCNVAALAALPLDRKLKCLYMVSLAQVSHDNFPRPVWHESWLESPFARTDLIPAQEDDCWSDLGRCG